MTILAITRDLFIPLTGLGILEVKTSFGIAVTILVPMYPGEMVLTVTPLRATSRARAFVKPSGGKSVASGRRMLLSICRSTVAADRERGYQYGEKDVIH